MGYTIGFHKTWLDNPLGLLGKSSRNNGLFSKPKRVGFWQHSWDFSAKCQSRRLGQANTPRHRDDTFYLSCYSWDRNNTHRDSGDITELTIVVYCMTVYDCMIGHVNLVIPEVFRTRPRALFADAGGTFGERRAEDSGGQQWRCVLLWLGPAVLGRNEVWLGRYQVLAMKRWSWSYQSPSIYGGFHGRFW